MGGGVAGLSVELVPDEPDELEEDALRRSKFIGTAVAIAALATLTAAPAAHAACPEEPCNAPGNDPTYPFVCLVTYEEPIKDVTSCFDPRP
jgi:hypothetical protein